MISVRTLSKRHGDRLILDKVSAEFLVAAQAEAADAAAAEKPDAAKTGAGKADAEEPPAKKKA